MKSQSSYVKSHARSLTAQSGRRALAAPGTTRSHASPRPSSSASSKCARNIERTPARCVARAARELLLPGVGEDGEGPAGVAGARLAAQEAVGLEAVDQAGQAAAAEDHRAGEVAHAHAVLVGVGELHEHLVGHERQAVPGLELVVERLRQRGVGAQQTPPGAQLAIVEARLAAGGCRYGRLVDAAGLEVGGLDGGRHVLARNWLLTQ